MVTKNQVIKVLKTIYDPEIAIDIWSLGLVYDIKILKNSIKITMTLTTPTCPYGPMLLDKVEDSIKEITNSKVVIEVVFDPPWEPSDEIKAILGV